MKYYKLAKPNGYDFHTGKTINYRVNLGEIVTCPQEDEAELCSGTVIHASRNPNDCFQGATKIPCSAYEVNGKPVVKDDNKCGFRKLKIVREIQPEKLFKWNYREACNPVHPFKIRPPKITKKHILLLNQWASVWASVGASVGDSVRDSVGASVWDSVWASVRDSVWASVRDSVWDSVWDSIRASVRDSVWDSIRASVRAYIGYIFKDCVKEWKYIEHKEGEYPYQPGVDLWKLGLVTSYDGRIWRLHGGKDAKILWEGKIKEQP